MADTLDVVVAGAGSAGLTAALSSARPSAGTLFDVLDEERKRLQRSRRPTFGSARPQASEPAGERPRPDQLGAVLPRRRQLVRS